MSTRQLTRVFKFQKETLQDIDPNFSPELIKETYAARYPELVNATISGPIIKGNQAVYTFAKTLGTKG
jgi:PRTRC genetic system protein C